jgi:hypothetical protein
METRSILFTPFNSIWLCRKILLTANLCGYSNEPVQTGTHNPNSIE